MCAPVAIPKQMFLLDLWTGKLRPWKFTDTAVSSAFNVLRPNSPASRSLLRPIEALCVMKPSPVATPMTDSAPELLTPLW